MPGYKRTRTASKYEEKNVSEFVATAVAMKATVSYFAGVPDKMVDQVLLVGTEAQLKDAAVQKLPFYTAEVGALIVSAATGKITSTLVGTRRVCVGVVTTEASRTNCPTRPDAITSLIVAALADGKAVTAMDVFVRSDDEVAVASAVAKGLPTPFSAKKGIAEKAYAAAQPALRVYYPAAALKAKATSLQAIASSIQLSRFLMDAPTNLLDTVTYTEIAAGYAEELKCGIDIIMGEELRERGYGGVYGVGKAAEFPPALVTLSHKPADMDPKEKIAFVGKGIVYDTGGLAIKTPATFMCGMKDDMGGSAAVLSAFVASVRIGCKFELSCTLCLADNAIGPRAQRNDDIIRMKSGVTVEIKNTDAEGRLVLGDGVFHASSLMPFTPTLIVDMATLTGAQGVATGKIHAAIFANTDGAEERAVQAGKICGDVCFPVVYAPEYHHKEYASTVADVSNLTDSANASVSCAGYFVGNNLSKDYKGDWIHVDLAFPAVSNKCGTGYGVMLGVQMAAAQWI